MRPTQPRDILKQSPRRTVFVADDDRAASGRAVVKRFHATGLVDRRLDVARAKREERSSAILRAAGLPVPRTLGVDVADGTPELSSEWIEDAATLRELALGSRPWPASRAKIQAELGRVLARAHAACVEHEDLHAGNVLVDPRGAVWLVDVGHARVRRRRAAVDLVSDLVVLAADLRETLSPQMRARIMRSWLDALPRERRDELPPRGSLAAAIEPRARARRRAVVFASRRRWARDSSVCEPFTLARCAGYRRRGLTDEATRAAFLNRALDETSAIITTTTNEGATLDAWSTAARLEEHAIDAARPLVLVLAPRPRAFFQVPLGSRTLELALAEADSNALRNVSSGLGAVLGSLFDRGLKLRDDCLLRTLVTPRGTLLLAPGARIARGDLDDPRGALATMRNMIDALDVTSRVVTWRDSFTLAFVRAQRSGRAFRSDMAARVTTSLDDLAESKRALRG